MFVLNVDLTLKPSSQQALEKAYLKVFVPAISSQQGFTAVSLLRPLEQEDEYRLCITFDRQASQQKWVASDLHQQVWPQMEAHCGSYAVSSYTTV